MEAEQALDQPRSHAVNLGLAQRQVMQRLLDTKKQQLALILAATTRGRSGKPVGAMPDVLPLSWKLILHAILTVKR